MIPDEESRRDVLPWFFEAAIRAGQLYGEVRTTETIDGGAVRNLTFYERQGFEIQGNGRIPHEGPTYWTMIRQPQIS